MSRPVNGADVYRAVSHPVRRRVIDLLRNQDRTVADILAHTEVAAGTLSRHLDVLQSANLIGRRRIGRTWVCRLRRRALTGVAAWSTRAVQSRKNGDHM